MNDINNLEEAIDGMELHKNISYIPDEGSFRIFIGGEQDLVSERTDNHILLLDQAEKAEIADIIDMNKDKILKEWINDKDMSHFFSKYNISAEEVTEYLIFFGGEKILGFLYCELTGTSSIEPKQGYISTKFLSYIKKKNLGIEDLLKIVIILRNCVIEHFLKLDIRIINQITLIFDKISTNLSKNYNDITLKLLAQYTNAINSSNIISKTDIRGIIIDANEEFCRLSGYTREEMIGNSHNIVRHPDMPKEIFKDLWDTIQDKRIWKGIIKNRTKDNGSYWVKATVVPIIDENEKIVEYISIRTDITELKEAYKNLEEYTEALNETNLVLKLDVLGRIISVNDNFLKMSLHEADSLIGKCYLPELFSTSKKYENGSRVPIVDKVQLTEMHQCMNEKKIWKGVLKNRNLRGLYFWTSASIVPILDLNEDVVEYVIIQTDITDLEISQQELKISLNKQKELDMRKDDFLNIASHELRTPMTSVKGYISMILDGDAGEINDEVRTYLEQVYKSSQRLLNLINDMLDISKIESGKQEITIEKIDLTSLMHETQSEIKSLFEKKNQKFTNIIDFEKFEYNTDGNKLKQVLLNLLGNAHKFTAEGGDISLHTALRSDEIEIRIKDSGIGIAKSDIKKVFEKFGQVKNSLTREINGTGLGLPISKAIIDKLGGYIDLDSELGVGSTFTIHLPIS